MSPKSIQMTGNRATDVAWSKRLIATTTVHQARLQLFQPTRFPTWCTRGIETPYGTGTITGRLGTSQAFLMEAICYHALARRDIEDGSLQLLVDPHQIRSTMSASSRYSASGIAALARDLRSAVIQVSIPRLGELPVIDGILDRLMPSTRTRRHPVTGAERHLWRAQLSPTYRAWVERDLPLHYNPQLLALLRYGISQALARFVLTHRGTPNGGWMLDTLLVAVGIDDADRTTMRNRRREVRIDADKLRLMGIIVQGNRVTRDKGGVQPPPADPFVNMRTIQATKDSHLRARGP